MMMFSKTTIPKAHSLHQVTDRHPPLGLGLHMCLQNLLSAYVPTKSFVNEISGSILTASNLISPAKGLSKDVTSFMYHTLSQF